MTRPSIIEFVRRWKQRSLACRLDRSPSQVPGLVTQPPPGKISVRIGLDTAQFMEALQRASEAMRGFNRAYVDSMLWADWEWVD